MAAEAPLIETEQSKPAGGSMTLLEHLFELRKRVFWSSVAIVGGMAIFFVPLIGFRAIEFLLEPAVRQTPTFRAQAITPMETMVVYFRVALLGGVAIGMPIVLYQAIRFIHPALTPGEKRWIYPIVAGASFAFLGGMAFGYYVVLPPAYGFLFNFGTSFADPHPTISSYIDLTTRLILLVGVVFETPLVIMGLARLRVVNVRRLLGWWRYAIVVCFAFSAIATPTPDPITQTLIAGPMVVLYFIGIGLAWLVRRR